MSKRIVLVSTPKAIRRKVNEWNRTYNIGLAEYGKLRPDEALWYAGNSVITTLAAERGTTKVLLMTESNKVEPSPDALRCWNIIGMWLASEWVRGSWEASLPPHQIRIARAKSDSVWVRGELLLPLDVLDTVVNDILSGEKVREQPTLGSVDYLLGSSTENLGKIRLRKSLEGRTELTVIGPPLTFFPREQLDEFMSRVDLQKHSRRLVERLLKEDSKKIRLQREREEKHKRIVRELLAGLIPQMALFRLDRTDASHGTDIDTSELARVVVDLKSAHLDWTQEKVAMAAATKLKDTTGKITAETVRNIFRKGKRKWNRGKRSR